MFETGSTATIIDACCSATAVLAVSPACIRSSRYDAAVASIGSNGICSSSKYGSSAAVEFKLKMRYNDQDDLMTTAIKIIGK
jgi:hypothetical protein